MSEYLCGPDNALPNFDNEGIQDFLNSPGSIIDVRPDNAKPIYPNAIKNHAIVPLGNLLCKEEHEVDEESEVGYLIEHLATGLHYFVYKDEDGYRAKGVLDFKGTKEEPYDIALTWEEHRRWVRSEIDIPGTRIGGVPLNSDGTPYSGLWPYLTDGRRLSFLAQYEMKDGRYLHLFIGFGFDDYNYQDPEFEEIMMSSEDPFSCAILEGGPAPSWMQMKYWEHEGLKLVHPDDAYTLQRDNNEILPAPEWIQDDYTPDSGEYKFLIQIGDTDNLDDEMSFVWGDGGDLYLFVNSVTNEVKVIIQCS